MSQTQWQLQLSPEEVERSESLRKEGQTHRELMEQVYELGLYQLEYRQGPAARAARKAYQQKRNAENKLGRELLKKAQTDPEMSVRLGLGTRVEL
jgi:hypothetical protein